MKLIKPNVELWQQGEGITGIWSQIARATRVCYQSKPRNGETAEDFVKRVILKPAEVIPGTYDFNKMHGAMLEHGTVYLEVPVESSNDEAIKLLLDNKYTDFTERKGYYHITTNMRVIVENNLEYIIDDYFCYNPEFCIKRYTFSVITDIGVTREMNRHRTFSIAEQSTRFCDFSNDKKFGDDIAFIEPNWNGCDDAGTELLVAYDYAERFYKCLRKLGYRPEQARQVLPLGVKTQAIYTAFEDDWEHFIALRADNVSGKVHPNMERIAKMIKEEYIKAKVNE